MATSVTDLVDLFAWSHPPLAGKHDLFMVLASAESEHPVDAAMLVVLAYLECRNAMHVSIIFLPLTPPRISLLLIIFHLFLLIRCPSVLEENCLCTTWGRVGLISPENEKARFWILHIGFGANLIAFFLTIWSCLSISARYGALNVASFSWGVLNLGDETRNFELHVGLRAAALDLPNYDEPFVATFDEFCALASDDLVEYMQGGNVCFACQEVSSSMVASTIFSVITFIPSFATDVLRMHSNYDVNCQKSFSTLFATLTILLSLNTLLKYSANCFGSFYEGEVPFDRQYNVQTDESLEPAYVVHFDWKVGPGLYCLGIATILKFVDVVCNVIIPTPTITRDIKEKRDYEDLNPKGASDEVEEEGAEPPDSN